MPAAPTPPLSAARPLFSLDPGIARLNHGSFGAVPIPVQLSAQVYNHADEYDRLAERLPALRAGR